MDLKMTQIIPVTMATPTGKAGWFWGSGWAVRCPTISPWPWKGEEILSVRQRLGHNFSQKGNFLINCSYETCAKITLEFTIKKRDKWPGHSGLTKRHDGLAVVSHQSQLREKQPSSLAQGRKSRWWRDYEARECAADVDPQFLAQVHPCHWLASF
jgi:hypothetical protein